MQTIYIALGSNLGEREENLNRALSELTPEITILRISPVYETEPMYLQDQPIFLNAVCEAETQLLPIGVLQKLKSIENGMGKHEHNKPRIVDLDLLFYENEIINMPELILPHPRIAERPFVLVPMSDIAPDFMHPILSLSIGDLKRRLDVKARTVRIFPWQQIS